MYRVYVLLSLVVITWMGQLRGDSKTDINQLKQQLAAEVERNKASDTKIANLTIQLQEQIKATKKLAESVTSNTVGVSKTLATTTTANQTAIDLATLARQTADRAADRAAAKIDAQTSQLTTQIGQIRENGYWGFLTLLIVPAFTFATVVAGLYDKKRSDNQKRQWALEDQANAAAKAAEHQVAVLAAVGDVKQEAHAAYKEANTVNLKLEKIGVKMADGKPLDEAHGVRVEGVKE